MPRRFSAALPDFIRAKLVGYAPEGDAWLHEVKIDGYRVATRIARGKARMFTQRANDWTTRIKPIVAILNEPQLFYPCRIRAEIKSSRSRRLRATPRERSGPARESSDPAVRRL
jgi:hypothetical protein